ncbi:MAG: aldo/keto reductase [Bdellovibrionota bacterium]|nr:MAG: aldo/keto reductase [Bdellovibrionota bacterium]
MDYTTLGRTNLKISRLALGGWQAHGWERSSPQLFKAVVSCAFDSGITLFDTAPAYGNGLSERLLGEVLSGKRAQVVIATKFPHTADTPAKIRASLERSLRDLATDYVDIFQQHWPAKSLAADEMLICLERLRDEGKIRAIGVSNWMEPEWVELQNPERIDVLQPCYNLLWRSIERDVLPRCIAHSIGVLCYSPLCQGLLSGRYAESRVWTDSRKRNRLFQPQFAEQRNQVLSVLRATAADHGATPAQVAIAWILSQPGISSVLLGTSEPAQLTELMAALEIRLSPPELQALSASSDSFARDWPAHDSLWGWHSKA